MAGFRPAEAGRRARDDSQLHRMNPEGTGALTDHDQLWQSVTKILTTPTGSRVMRREFGSAIPDLLDAPQNAVTRMQLMGAAAIALAQWEPRSA